MEHFIQGERIWWDTETTGLRPYLGDQPFAFSFANELGHTEYFEFPVDPFTRQVQYDEDILHPIRLLLEDESIVKGGHNVKFDTRMAEVACDIVVAGPGGPVRDGGRCEETMFMAHACNSLEVNYKLKRLTKSYGLMDDDDEDALQKSVVKLRRKAKKLGWKIAYEESPKADGTVKRKAVTAADYWLGHTMSIHHPDLISGEEGNLCEYYARRDALRAMFLGLFYFDLMEELEVRDTYEFEMANWPVFYQMESRGVCIRPERLEARAKELVERLEKIRPGFMRFAWAGFNVDSDDDVRELVYNRLKLPVNPEHLTEKRRQPGVNFRALEEHRHHLAVGSILQYRGTDKAYGFCRQYQKLSRKDPVSPTSLVLNPDFHQVGPKTGRVSVSNPNIQQVTSIDTSRSIDSVDARGSYGPRPGYWWLHNDYRGMEVRIFAEVSEEPNMLRAIAEGREIHDEVANRGWGGEGNPQGVIECIHALGLDGTESGTKKEVRAVWKEYEISDWTVLTESDRWKIASHWLARYKWDIVKAQASVDLKNTKNKSKLVTFAKIYGGGPDAVKDLLKVSLFEAREFMDHYDRTFPRIPEFAKELTRQARLDGCIRTLWNRRLAVFYDKAYRSVNYLVQGSAADLLKSAMIKCHEFLKSSGLDAYIIMTIHDELVFEAAKACMVPSFVQKIQELMEDTDGRLKVPMPTDASVVTSAWNEKKKITASRLIAA